MIGHLSPSLETGLNEVLREEQRQLIQGQLAHQSTSGPIKVAYAVKGKLSGRDFPQRDMSKIQCHKC